MSGNSALSGYGKVRWRRFALILAPAVALAAVLVVLTAQSVLAVSFSISGIPFVVTASELRGQGFEQFGVLDHSIRNNCPATPTRSCSPPTRSGQLSLSQPVPERSAGRPRAPDHCRRRQPAGHGHDLVVDADRLSGNVERSTM